jgi:outer membrane protein assembly factor BamB
VCDHFRGAGSSPILDHKRLYLSYDGADFQYVAALDKKTGETVWKTSRRIDYGTDNGDLKKAYSTPALIPHNGRAILISPAATATVAYDAETGEELWQLVHGGMNASMPPVYDRAARRLFVQSGDGGLGLVSAPWTPGAPPGDVAWSFNKAPSRSSPILVDGVLFMANNNGVGFALDALTGEQQWTERFGSSYSASPIHASGRIYFFSETGETHVVAPQRTFKLLALNQLETGFMASPAVVGNSLVVRTRTHLYRIAER